MGPVPGSRSGLVVRLFTSRLSDPLHLNHNSLRSLRVRGLNQRTAASANSWHGEYIFPRKKTHPFFVNEKITFPSAIEMYVKIIYVYYMFVLFFCILFMYLKSKKLKSLVPFKELKCTCFYHFAKIKAYINSKEYSLWIPYGYAHVSVHVHVYINISVFISSSD